MDSIVRALRSIGVEGARWVEENIDPQYAALEHVYPHVGEDLRVLAVVNALISYQLSGRGEDYWWEFARWFSEHGFEGVSSFEAFLRESKHNKRLVGVKVKRVNKVVPVLLSGVPSMDALPGVLSRALNTSPHSKTVCFAVKMLGYAERIVTGVFSPFPFDVPVPVDSRVEKVTRGLTDTHPLHFWNNIARRSGVPPLHIDSLIWPLFDEGAREQFVKRFGEAGRRWVSTVFT